MFSINSYVELTVDFAGYKKDNKFKVVKSRHNIDGTHDGKWIGPNYHDDKKFTLDYYSVEFDELNKNHQNKFKAI